MLPLPFRWTLKAQDLRHAAAGHNSYTLSNLELLSGIDSANVVFRMKEREVDTRSLTWKDPVHIRVFMECAVIFAVIVELRSVARSDVPLATPFFGSKEAYLCLYMRPNLHFSALR